jgi:hypothetical protein
MKDIILLVGQSKVSLSSFTHDEMGRGGFRNCQHGFLLNMLIIHFLTPFEAVNNNNKFILEVSGFKWCQMKSFC